MAAEEFRPPPSGCVSVHTCLHMQVCSVVLPLQPLRGLKGKPCTSHLEHISNKVKVPLPFLSPCRREAHQLRQLVSVRVQSADVLTIPQFTPTCATAH